jgi:hypothetical protein
MNRTHFACRHRGGRHTPAEARQAQRIPASVLGQQGELAGRERTLWGGSGACGIPEAKATPVLSHRGRPFQAVARESARPVFNVTASHSPRGRAGSRRTRERQEEERKRYVCRRRPCGVYRGPVRRSARGAPRAACCPRSAKPRPKPPRSLSRVPVRHPLRWGMPGIPSPVAHAIGPRTEQHPGQTK